MASAAGYVGAHIVHPERELGAAYDAAMQEKIFDRLGMHDTTFSMTRALATANHASPHGKDVDGKLQLASLDIIGTVGDAGNPGVITCTANSDGSLTSCGDSGTGLPYADLSVVGGYVYATAGNSQVQVCSVNVSNGALTCTTQTITVSGASSGGVSLLGSFAANGNHMYLSYFAGGYRIAVCDLAAAGTLSNCVDAGLSPGRANGVQVH